MTFVDTSAIFAILDRDDHRHTKAKNTWIQLLRSGTPIFTTNYVLVECCALAQNRLGMDAVRTIQQDLVPALDIHWIDRQIHTLATVALLAAGRRKLSLVDCSSFAMLRQTGTRIAFAFDQHFEEEGFVFPHTIDSSTA